MNFIFLMDPLETVVFKKDTTFILMLGARKRGHKIFYVPKGGLTFKHGKIIFHTIPVTPQKNAQKPFLKHPPVTLSVDQVDAIFMRNDPPFDQQYLLNTWLLDKISPKIPIINEPLGIRTVNEKIWASQFIGITPQTLLSRQRSELLKFIKFEKNVIAKPVNAYGGQAVFYIRQGDLNTNVILETLSVRFTKEIILQQYIPEARKGDKRILLLNGELLGAVLRVHSQEDHRNNFFAGGKPKATSITPSDKKIISTLKPYLRELGLYFVGIDIIGRYLIEVNVTSPTCLQEMNRLYKQNLEGKVIDFVEKLVKQRTMPP